ncbi:MAG: carbon monoxide dehydrogenase subunit G [Anaerolineaceae bacterium]
MDVTGEQHFKAPRELVWEMLMDRAALKACIPGCETLVEVSPGSYRLTARVGIATVRGTYGGTVTIADAVQPESYRLVTTADGAPGGAQGTARITLSETATGTTVRYVAEMKAQGGLARLGGPLLAGTAKIMAGQFFKAMERLVERRSI